MAQIIFKRCVLFDQDDNKYSFILDREDFLTEITESEPKPKGKKRKTVSPEKVDSKSETELPTKPVKRQKKKQQQNTDENDKPKPKKNSPFFNWIKKNNEDLTRNFRLERDLNENQSFHRHEFVKFAANIWNDSPQELKDNYRYLNSEIEKKE